MKPLLIGMLLLLSGDSLAQESLDREEQKKLQYGFSLLPDFSYRSLKSDSDSDSDQNKFIINSRNEMEIGTISLSGGLNILFKISEHLSLETGVLYAQRGYQTKEIDAFIMVYTPDIPEKVKFVYRYHYVDIPINASVTLGKKKVRFVGGLGVSANIFVAQTTISYSVFTNQTLKDRSTSYSGIRRFNLSTHAFAGASVHINERSVFRIEPTLRFNAFKVVDAPIAERLWNTGIHARYFFTF